MENAIDPPEKVAEDAVNTAAAAAMDTTPPATANDDETSPSNDDGSAWVLVQKKRRTQAELSVSQPMQGTTPSELRGNTTQRKPTTSRPPPLPLHDYKAILRPLGGLRLDQWTRPTLTRAIGVAASLPPAEVDRLVFRLRPEQNLAVVSTPHEHIALNLYSVQHLRLGEHTYPVSIYIAAPDNSCKGIIYGVDPGTSPSELMDHLITPCHTVLQARMMGKTSTALITFEGLQVSHYNVITAPNTGATCIAHASKFARFVSGWDIVLTTAPHRSASHARHAALRTQHQGTRARRGAVHAEGITPTTDTGCPARVRPPVNKDRVRKALQQEQQQRDVEHPPHTFTVISGRVASSRFHSG
ncbi:hypothetical protein MTO96_029155 [Rhipicephalus appendiculatus]